jgi:hypothetical protein
MLCCRCLFAEMLKGDAILKGKDNSEQLCMIFHLCGIPSNDPEVLAKYEEYENFHRIMDGLNMNEHIYNRPRIKEKFGRLMCYYCG